MRSNPISLLFGPHLTHYAFYNMATITSTVTHCLLSDGNVCSPTCFKQYYFPHSAISSYIGFRHHTCDYYLVIWSPFGENRTGNGVWLQLWEWRHFLLKTFQKMLSHLALVKVHLQQKCHNAKTPHCCCTYICCPESHPNCLDVHWPFFWSWVFKIWLKKTTTLWHH